MLNTNSGIKKIELIIEATPKEGMSLKELAKELEDLGNPIMDIDKENGKIKILHEIYNFED